MDFEQLKKWLEMAKKQQTDEFWNLFSDPSSFQEFMNDSRNNAASQNFANQPMSQKVFPPIDLYLTEQEIIILADLAGCKKEQLKVSISGTKLLLKGSIPSLIPVKPFHQERNNGDFQRVIELPEPASSSAIRAKFENGLLMIWYRRNRPDEESVIIE